MAKLQRRLAAIMFTDIVGYSAMMQKDEAITHRLRNRHRDVFTRLTEEFGGEILQYYGDGTLSIFYSTTAAVECAVEIQRELKKAPKVPLRIGIHSGDITFSDEDVFGDGVNIASRVESLCVPGGVFISGKVYDDIKNHQTLRTKRVGSFSLKNIRDQISIFAITNPGVTVPNRNIPEAKGEPLPLSTATTVKQHAGSTKVLKRKETATKLAFPFGLFGIHRFYLGQKFFGVLYPLFFILGITEGIPLFIIIPPVLSFLDMILFKNMTEEEFNAKYNKGIEIAPATSPKTISKPDDQLDNQKSYLKAQFVRHKRAGESHLNSYEYKAAIKEFQKASELKYDDGPVHFYLARCYSMMEDTKNALTHLDAAIAFGIPIKQIKTTDDLAYLRVQSEFKDFENSNYRFSDDFVPITPSSKRKNIEKLKPKNIPASKQVDSDTPPPDFLEKLQKLSELREKGYLTEEEFLKQKEKLRLK